MKQEVSAVGQSGEAVSCKARRERKWKFPQWDKAEKCKL